MLYITNTIGIPLDEIDLQAIRAQGAGGQNVNKVSSAVHLRFDIAESSLPEVYKNRLLALSDQRIAKNGIVVIKAQQYRTQEKNRADALERLREFIVLAVKVPKKRKPTKPTRGAKERRLKGKKKRSEIKSTRGPVQY